MTALLLSVTVPASAQLYKWVDDEGVTNYSNAAPVGAKGTATVYPLPILISTYAPDPGVEREIQTLRESAAKPAEDAKSLALREFKLKAQRIMAVAAANDAQAAYASCLESRRVDCGLRGQDSMTPPAMDPEAR
ncbi:MAG: DUF4124 domain-containing protein [Burkholderiales bacterium]